ncbi:general secretion pathway protein GspK [Ottowia thiooxydans]|uniref:General secretion pathway protein K n=1 Tax=Ottowia thiooxydans TaxID=219182 RepID=A0ABV2QEN5_9BURK
MKRSRPHHTSGMALIAVLWIVAALSLLVTGMSQTVRQQILVAGTQRDEIVGQALGEAAVALTLQEIQISPQRPRGMVQGSQRFDGVDMQVEVMPLNGLVSLNGAGAPMLSNVLRVAGGLNLSAADAMANTVVQWRDERAEGSDKRWFESVEDLLLVPGFDYALYERVSSLFTAVTRTGGVDPLSAPPEVLAVLTDGNLAQAADIAGRRSTPGANVDTSLLNQGLVSRANSDEYRISVKVPLEEGKMLLLTRDIGLTFTPTGEPWRVFSASRRILSASSP